VNAVTCRSAKVLLQAYLEVCFQHTRHVDPQGSCALINARIFHSGSTGTARALIQGNRPHLVADRRILEAVVKRNFCCQRTSWSEQAFSFLVNHSP
jgi:hypothetical protein